MDSKKIIRQLMLERELTLPELAEKLPETHRKNFFKHLPPSGVDKTTEPDKNSKNHDS